MFLSFLWLLVAYASHEGKVMKVFRSWANLVTTAATMSSGFTMHRHGV